MKIFNPTRYRISWITSRIQPSQITATFVVKSTYSLTSGKTAVPLDEGELPTGDVPVEGGPEGSLYYESDMAPLKLKTDVLLSGSCHAPGGRPVTACKVEFQVGILRKGLVVVGDRKWRKTLGVHTTTDPEPFTRMSLGYENSFGGSGFAKNPLGKGIGKNSLEDGNSVRWLPNIENPARLIKDDDPKQDPSGFGPIPRTWAQRCVNLGTYSSAYMKERWPWFPADFDFSYFNAAPLDQQLERPLRGDETLGFVNMHPDHSEYGAYLPGDRPQLFLREANGAAEGAGPDMPLQEVRLALDTLFVDMDQEKLILVWRGLATVKDLKLKSVAEIHVLDGSIQANPLTTAEYEARLKREAIAFEEAEAEEERAEEAQFAGIDKQIADVNLEVDKVQLQHDRLEKEQLMEAHSLLARNGMSMSLLSSSSSAPVKESDFAEALAAVKLHSPEKAPEAARLVPQVAAMEAPPDETVESEFIWTRELVEAQLKKKGCFADQDLKGLDLQGLNFAGAGMSNCLLAGSVLTGNDLSKVDLTGADLSGADLKGAVLKGADCTDADFSKAVMDKIDMSGCCLTGAVLTAASLKGARLTGVTGDKTDFAEADMTQASLAKNRLVQPDFRAAILAGADFSGCVMPHATLEEVKAAGIVMTGADVTGLRASENPDFSGGDFREISAEGSQWEGANLDGTQFQGAILKNANFTSASLRKVRLDRAVMVKAVFEEATLENCILMAANLFRASFERATVRRCDFRQSNMYEVEFWDAVLDENLLEGANLKMTKLARA